MGMKHFNDPKITVKEALEYANGNQSLLGVYLGISRSSVNEWVTSDRAFLPPLQAYRFRDLKSNSSGVAA